MISFFKNYKLTVSFLFFLTLLAMLQAVFNFHESPRQITAHITSSHQHPHPRLTADGILDGTTLWHAPAKFPQWIQFRFSEPVAITQLQIESQENSPQGKEYIRSPRTFQFMGRNGKDDWEELLSVNNAQYETGGQWKSWDVKSDKKHTIYRLTITANNGDPDWLTIHQMKFGYK